MNQPGDRVWRMIPPIMEDLSITAFANIFSSMPIVQPAKQYEGDLFKPPPKRIATQGNDGADLSKFYQERWLFNPPNPSLLTHNFIYNQH